MSSDVALWSIPFVAAFVGWLTNWLAIQMSFYPVHFVGFTSWLGWQGVIPRKAEKMAHICVDQTMAQFGDLNRVYEQLGSERIVAQILAQVAPRLDEYTDEVMYEIQPVLWDNLPNFVRQRIYRWSREQLPARVESLVEDFGEDLSQLVDLKALLSQELRHHPDLMNRIFSEAGQVELRTVIHCGGLIGGLLGLCVLPLWSYFAQPWLLPMAGFVIGFITNWLAINLIFRPLRPRQLLFWRLQGLFLRRQNEISDVWSRLVAEELLTVEKVADAMINGSEGTRTRAIIQKHLRPLLDNSIIMKLSAQVTVGMSGYTDLRQAINEKAVYATSQVFHDPTFNKERAPVVADVLAKEMRALEPAQFQNILRPAFKEEEWHLMLVGGVLGAIAGLIQSVFLFSWF